MDLIKNANDIMEINKVMLHPDRLAIAKIIQHGYVSFNFIKSALKLSDGNLASHMRAMKDHVDKRKAITTDSQKVITLYELNDSGKRALKYITQHITQHIKEDA